MQLYHSHRIPLGTLILFFSILFIRVKSERKNLLKFKFSSKKLTQEVQNETRSRYFGKIRDRLGISRPEEALKMVLYSSLVLNGTNIDHLENITDSNFKENSPIKFFIHGWFSGGDHDTSISVKDAYLENKDVNVFVVHWDKLAKNFFYPEVLSTLHIVANFTADLIKNLIEKKKIIPKRVHLIGHSLGAHISGMAGKELIKAGYKIGRITGLDPAAPGFGGSERENKLSINDADFVDVMHTTGKNIGIRDPLGHVDYYPNGGISPMPGCGILLMGEICSHSRSWAYFADNLYEPMLAMKCNSFSEFKRGKCRGETIEVGGEFIRNKEARGNFYFMTARKSPFSLGKKGLAYSRYKTDS